MKELGLSRKFITRFGVLKSIGIGYVQSSRPEITFSFRQNLFYDWSHGSKRVPQLSPITSFFYNSCYKELKKRLQTQKGRNVFCTAFFYGQQKFLLCVQDQPREITNLGETFSNQLPLSLGCNSPDKNDKKVILL